MQNPLKETSADLKKKCNKMVANVISVHQSGVVRSYYYAHEKRMRRHIT